MRVGSNPTADIFVVAAMSQKELSFERKKKHIEASLLEVTQVALLILLAQHPRTPSKNVCPVSPRMVLRDGSSRGLAAVNDGLALAVETSLARDQMQVRRALLDMFG